MRRERPPLGHGARVALTALGAGLPGAAVALGLLWLEPHPAKVRWTLTVAVLGTLFALTASVRAQVVHPLRLISSLLASLRDRDYSVRARHAEPVDALGEIYAAINDLAPALLSQRMEALDAANILTKVMDEIDVAIFAFDPDDRLCLLNPAARAMLGRSAGLLLGSTAAQLGLTELLAGEAPRTISRSFASGNGPWELRRRTFLQGGRPHRLVVLTDLKRALREEERLAWQRLVRVIGHEINNSLAPITSIADSLQDLLRRPGDPDAAEDLVEGLAVIRRRAETLSRFTTSYTKLARLPPPELGAVRVREWIHRAAALEKRAAVRVVDGPDLTIRADGDQLDQLVINLIQNAADAVQTTGGAVTVTWSASRRELDVRVIDEGVGLGETANLFVPFFTTKPHGSGIGLALSAQIAEAHGGSLSLRNRLDGSGCEAILLLPL
ncbi:MAG: PAS domain-containing sensor histidine kinase [Polyangiaceae bacterium]|nr:PAS domain-containing sensor histidine kinase [Polyangiaceae bacterium]